MMNVYQSYRNYGPKSPRFVYFFYYMDVKMDMTRFGRKLLDLGGHVRYAAQILKPRVE